MPRALPWIRLHLPTHVRTHARVVLPVFFTAALVAARFWRSGTPAFGFLLFNLTLAALPLGFAVLASRAHRSGRSTLAVLLLGLWLLFLPNAPYVMTDLIHLHARANVPLWFDAAMLGTAGLAGVMLGVAALREARRTIALLVGPKLTFIALGLATLASGYGIYLGRFARLNSWDAVLHPSTVVRGALPPLLDPFAHPRAWVVTLVFGALFAVAYLAQHRDDTEPSVVPESA
jgi:uncharacterized membrane protein